VKPEDEKGAESGQPTSADVWRFAGLGAELAAGIAAFVLIGFWLDWKLGTGRTATLVAAVLGLIGGFYNFYRQALAMQRRLDARKPRKSETRDDDAGNPRP
jgi:F0F1-type ATP synthase assembly protein I